MKEPEKKYIKQVPMLKLLKKEALSKHGYIIVLLAMSLRVIGAQVIVYNLPRFITGVFPDYTI